MDSRRLLIERPKASKTVPLNVDEMVGKSFALAVILVCSSLTLAYLMNALSVGSHCANPIDRSNKIPR